MKRQEGMTLIEIMVSLLLGLMVVGGALSIYISSIRGSAGITKSARLNYDLDSVLSLMVNDIRRAGYWGGAISNYDDALNDASCTKGNPFTCGIANIIISNKTGEANDTCILYTYDVDNGDSSDDVTVPDGELNLDEFFGFRLNGTGIDMRSSVDDLVHTDCDSGNWENIIETNLLTIDTVSFSISGSKSVSLMNTVIESRQINIDLSGFVNNDNSVKKSLLSIIKIRNNRIYLQP